MSRESKIILWLGLIMIVLSLMKDWSTLKTALFGTGGGANKRGLAGTGIPLIPPIFPYTINPNEGPPGGKTPPVENPPVEPPPVEVPPVEPPPVVPLISHRSTGG